MNFFKQNIACTAKFITTEVFLHLLKGGLTQARESDNRVSRYFWSLVFVAGTVLTCVSVHSTISKFLEYNVIVNSQYNLMVYCICGIKTLVTHMDTRID